MGLINYLTVASLLLLTLLLSSCGYLRKPEKEIVVQTVEVQKIIPVQPQPKPVDMIDVKFYVVTVKRHYDYTSQLCYIVPGPSGVNDYMNIDYR